MIAVFYNLFQTSGYIHSMEVSFSKKDKETEQISKIFLICKSLNNENDNQKENLNNIALIKRYEKKTIERGLSYLELYLNSFRKDYKNQIILNSTEEAVDCMIFLIFFGLMIKTLKERKNISEEQLKTKEDYKDVRKELKQINSETKKEEIVTGALGSLKNHINTFNKNAKRNLKSVKKFFEKEIVSIQQNSKKNKNNLKKYVEGDKNFFDSINKYFCFTSEANKDLVVNGIIKIRDLFAKTPHFNSLLFSLFVPFVNDLEKFQSIHYSDRIKQILEDTKEVKDLKTFIVNFLVEFCPNFSCELVKQKILFYKNNENFDIKNMLNDVFIFFLKFIFPLVHIKNKAWLLSYTTLNESYLKEVSLLDVFNLKISNGNEIKVCILNITEINDAEQIYNDLETKINQEFLLVDKKIILRGKFNPFFSCNTDVNNCINILPIQMQDIFNHMDGEILYTEFNILNNGFTIISSEVAPYISEQEKIPTFYSRLPNVVQSKSFKVCCNVFLNIVNDDFKKSDIFKTILTFFNGLQKLAHIHLYSKLSTMIEETKKLSIEKNFVIDYLNNIRNLIPKIEKNIEKDFNEFENQLNDLTKSDLTKSHTNVVRNLLEILNTFENKIKIICDFSWTEKMFNDFHNFSSFLKEFAKKNKKESINLNTLVYKIDNMIHSILTEVCNLYFLNCIMSKLQDTMQINLTPVIEQYVKDLIIHEDKIKTWGDLKQNVILNMKTNKKNINEVKFLNGKKGKGVIGLQESVYYQNTSSNKPIYGLVTVGPVSFFNNKFIKTSEINNSEFSMLLNPNFSVSVKPMIAYKNQLTSKNSLKAPKLETQKSNIIMPKKSGWSLCGIKKKKKYEKDNENVEMFHLKESTQ